MRRLGSGLYDRLGPRLALWAAVIVVVTALAWCVR
jgi:hypothetical protein